MLRPISTRRLTTTPTGCWATAVAGRPVGGEISKMLDIICKSSFASTKCGAEFYFTHAEEGMGIHCFQVVLMQET